MVTKTIDINTLQALKEALLPLVDPNTELILTDGDRPLIRVSNFEAPAQLNHERIPDLFPGIWMSDDFTEPLPDSFWLGDEA